MIERSLISVKEWAFDKFKYSDIRDINIFYLAVYQVFHYLASKLFGLKGEW